MATKLADRIREALKPYLDPGEELRSVGQVTPASRTTLMLFLAFAGYWNVGITQKRAIFVRSGANKPCKPDENVQFATPLSNLKLDGNRIALIAPVEGMPQDYGFFFGARRVTGLDKDEFTAALTT